MDNHYPAYAGSKVDGASRVVARMVDADPERKLNVQIAIVLDSILHPGRCIDQISIDLCESYLYTRPRCSELNTLGVLKKGPRVVSPTCGRTAHTVEPSDELERYLTKVRAHEQPDLAGVKIIIRRFILDRVLDAKIRGNHV